MEPLTQHRAILPLEQAMENYMFPLVGGPNQASPCPAASKLMEDVSIYADVPDHQLLPVLQIVIVV